MTGKLESRLLYLFTGEFAAAAVILTLYAVYPLNPHNSSSFTFAVALLIFLLLQAGLYWMLKWLEVKKYIKSPVKPYTMFKMLKYINLLLIASMPVIILIDINMIGSQILDTVFMMTLLYLFAVIEYINYYHIQLTNYQNGRWKPSSISKLLKRSKSTA